MALGSAMKSQSSAARGIQREGMREVMTPRSDICALPDVDRRTSSGQAIARRAQSFPIYHETLDEVPGMGTRLLRDQGARRLDWRHCGRRLLVSDVSL